MFENGFFDDDNIVNNPDNNGEETTDTPVTASADDVADAEDATDAGVVDNTDDATDEEIPVVDATPVADGVKKEAPPMYNWGKSGNVRRESSPIYIEHRKKEGGGKTGIIAVLLILTVVLSGFMGFMGGVLASKRTTTKGEIQVPATNITQEQLQAADKESFNAAAVAAVGLNSVVEITTEVVSRSTFLGNYVTNGAGSGVIIREDGYIVTNQHVIDGASKITVRTRDGKEHSATIIGYDTKTDLAVIKIEVSGLSPATYGTSADLVIGQPVLAIGNPLGELGGTVTEGIISALDRELKVENQVMRLLQTDASVNPGNSGGGLFDGKGLLVGIINAKSSGSGIEGLGFAIPIDTAKAVVEELIANGYVTGRAEAGIEVTYVDERTAYLYRLGDEGVYISAVFRGSAAEQAGLLSGDRIKKIEDKEITSPQDAVDVIQSHKAGETIDFEIEREGKSLVVSVTLDEQKPSLASLF